MKRKWKVVIGILAVLVATGFFYGQDGTGDSDVGIQGDLVVSFLDVGQGDSTFVQFPDGKAMLIDGGTASCGEMVARYIQGQGYSGIDWLVATHPHSDHIGGLAYILSQFDVGAVYMPRAVTGTGTYEAFLDAVSQKGLSIQTAKAGVFVGGGLGYSVEILAPVQKEYDDLNNYSAVVKIEYGDTAFLFMGDAETYSENQITQDVDADVLKIGHHGSSYSSGRTFLREVSPEYAVISVGAGNQYGHPAAETLANLEEMGVLVFRTDEDGTIVFTSDGNRISVRTGWVSQESPLEGEGK